MHINFLAVLIASLVPMVMGFIWYNPKVMGAAWMKAAGLSEETIKNSKKNMGLVFFFAFIFALMLAFSMQLLVIHQLHFASMLKHHEAALKNPSSELGALFARIMAQYGSEFRTFKHGMFHGFLSCLFIVLPVTATNGMFEQKSWKLIWINFGYWAINFMLMGGIVSAWQ